MHAVICNIIFINFKSFSLEELLENQKKDEAIHTLISIDRVRGLIETIALRKKFLKHLANIKKQPEGKYSFLYYVVLVITYTCLILQCLQLSLTTVM